MKCPECGEEAKCASEGETLVGYGELIDQLGTHWHNDNCLKRYYHCSKGHSWVESIIRRCNLPACTWRGNDTCFCHRGKKVERWTDPPHTEEEARADRIKRN